MAVRQDSVTPNGRIRILSSVPCRRTSLAGSGQRRRNTRTVGSSRIGLLSDSFYGTGFESESLGKSGSFWDRSAVSLQPKYYGGIEKIKAMHAC